MIMPIPSASRDDPMRADLVKRREFRISLVKFEYTKHLWSTDHAEMRQLT